MATHSRKAVVVGGGPVGCLSAMALARMGWDVEIYEARPGLRHHTLILHIFWVTNASDDHPDLRLPSSKSLSQQRSINLAISSRGIAALQAIDPAATERFMQTVIPMRGRMIHDKHGKLDSQLYDMDGQVGVFHFHFPSPMPLK
jgi:kynurenine 3-monooxygenase